jgi:hypothetical protein
MGHVTRPRLECLNVRLAAEQFICRKLDHDESNAVGSALRLSFPPRETHVLQTLSCPAAIRTRRRAAIRVNTMGGALARSKHGSVGGVRRFDICTSGRGLTDTDDLDSRIRGLPYALGDKPADAVLNTAAWPRDAAPP